MSKELQCNFCDFKSSKVEFMIEGPKGNICDKCVDLVTDIIEEGRNKAACRKARGQWEDIRITNYVELVRLINSCTEELQLNCLLNRVDEEIEGGNLVLDSIELIELSKLVNKVKDTLK